MFPYHVYLSPVPEPNLGWMCTLSLLSLLSISLSGRLSPQLLENTVGISHYLKDELREVTELSVEFWVDIQ